VTEIEFDLLALTYQVIATRDEWSATDLADAVLEATPQDAMRAAYRTALGGYVRQALGNAPLSDPRPGHTPSDAHRTLAGAGATPDAADHMRPDAQSRSVGGVGVPSRRLALFRANGFRMRIHAAPGVYKPLIDCSADELLYAAAESDRHARTNAAAAGRYRRLVKLMREHNAKTPADLPAEVLEEAFGDDDA
jgi:hypothetical protein